MNPAEMKQCIDDIIALGNKMRKANDLDERAAAKAPPPAGAVERFAKRFADKVPPSFLQLLSIYNGVACFDYVDIDLFNMKYLTENSEELEEEWVDAGKFQLNEIFVFGRSDSDSVALAFLLQKRADNGEMPVIMVEAHDVQEEWPSLEAYLVSRREFFKQELQLEKADRAALRDDE